MERVKYILKNFEKLSKDHNENKKKTIDKEKFTSLLRDKIKYVKNEKIKIIQDITLQRNLIVQKTENYVKEFQEKFHGDLPEKQILIEENQRLRKEIDEISKKSDSIRENIEKEIQEKERKNNEFQNDFINISKQKLEKAQREKESLLRENTQIKKDLKITSDPLTYKTHNNLDVEYKRFQNEIKKKKKDYDFILKENKEIKSSINHSITQKDLNDLNKDYIKTKNELNAVSNLGKKYKEQIDKIILKYPELKDKMDLHFKDFKENESNEIDINENNNK